MPLGKSLSPSQCPGCWPAWALCRPWPAQSHAATRGSHSPTGCTCSGTSLPWTPPQAVCTSPAGPGRSPARFQPGPSLKSPGQEIVNTCKAAIHCNISKRSFLFFTATNEREWDRPVNCCHICKWSKWLWPRPKEARSAPSCASLPFAVVKRQLIQKALAFQCYFK